PRLPFPGDGPRAARPPRRGPQVVRPRRRVDEQEPRNAGKRPATPGRTSPLPRRSRGRPGDVEVTAIELDNVAAGVDRPGLAPALALRAGGLGSVFSQQACGQKESNTMPRTKRLAVPALRFRPRLEALEDRCLLSGGVLDPTFGSGGMLATDV